MPELKTPNASADAGGGGEVVADGTTPKSISKATNGSPNTTTAAAPPPTMAYYEQIRRELRDMISRKKSIDRSLSSIEDQIYKFEGSYLLETRENGNIVKGFDGYLKGQYARATGSRRNETNIDADRIFTQSSGTYMKLLDQRDRENDSDDDRSAQKKKKKRKADDSDSSEEAGGGASSAGPKRVRISFKSNED